MQLSLLIVDLKKITGRHDLSDAYMTKYLNYAQKALDLKVPHLKTKGRYVAALTAGDTTLSIRYFRALDEIWVISPTDQARYRMEQGDLHDIRESYSNDPTTIEQGRPLYYALNEIGLAPEQKAESDLSAFDDVDDITTGDHYGYDGILWMPPADLAYTMQVYAWFFSAPLAADADISYWAARFPDLLLWQAAYEIAVGYRNATESRDWLEQINRRLMEIEKDKVQQDWSHGKTVMYG